MLLQGGAARSRHSAPGRRCCAGGSAVRQRALPARCGSMLPLLLLLTNRTAAVPEPCRHAQLAPQVVAALLYAAEPSAQESVDSVPLELSPARLACRHGHAPPGRVPDVRRFWRADTSLQPGCHASVSPVAVCSNQRCVAVLALLQRGAHEQHPLCLHASRKLVVCTHNCSSCKGTN